MEGQLLVCRTAESFIGFRLQCVQEVVMAAALEPVPEGPEELLGLLNYHGTLVPVISTGFLSGSQLKQNVQTSDQLVLVQLPADQSDTRLAGVLVNGTIGVFSAKEEQISRVRWQQFSDASLRWPASVLIDNQVVHLPEPAEILTPEARKAFMAYLERVGA